MPPSWTPYGRRLAQAGGEAGAPVGQHDAVIAPQLVVVEQGVFRARRGAAVLGAGDGAYRGLRAERGDDRLRESVPGRRARAAEVVQAERAVAARGGDDPGGRVGDRRGRR